MERFTDKNMTESQIDEIIELMNGEHGEALGLWTKRSENTGVATGLIAGAISTLILCGGAKVAIEAARFTWNWGRALVDCIGEHRPG